MSLSVRIQHRFPNFALNVNFAAPAGVTVLFGRSGSGKTSVAHTIAGLLRPESGKVVVDGWTLLDTENRVCLPPHQRRLGYIFQEARLFPHLTVRQNLLYGHWFAPTGASAVTWEHVIDMLGIEPLLQRRPSKLSGGERQRVAIGRALLASPKLILADEPLAALDEERKAEILPYFERLRDEVTVPILYVSHSVAEVARLATTMIVLEQGEMVQQGSPFEVFGDSSVHPTGVQDLGAVLDTVVVAHHEDGLTELRVGAESLWVTRHSCPIGHQLRVRIAAQDVLLSKDAPQGVSALNILRGEVVEVRAAAQSSVVVSLSTSGGRLLSRITQRSAAKLHFQVGNSCYAIVKSVSIAT
jgi:molybdate transport system ATP-binding protein